MIFKMLLIRSALYQTSPNEVLVPFSLQCNKYIDVTKHRDCFSYPMFVRTPRQATLVSANVQAHLLQVMVFNKLTCKIGPILNTTIFPLFFGVCVHAAKGIKTCTHLNLCNTMSSLCNVFLFLYIKYKSGQLIYTYYLQRLLTVLAVDDVHVQVGLMLLVGPNHLMCALD